MSSGWFVDVLVIAALREEYAQVLKVDAGAVPGTAWIERPGPLGHDVAFRAFVSETSQPLEVAVAWASDMGSVASASLAERLIAAYSPRCIAMCGVCAGRRGEVQIGDVIVADRLWMYDAGKLEVEVDDHGNRVERIKGDVITYNLRADWKKAAEAFGVPESMQALLVQRPRPMDNQADWVLERIVKGEDPRQHPNFEENAPDFGQVLKLLWKKKLVDDGTLMLTALGKKHIDKLLLEHFRGLPNPAPFKIRVGPIGTGNKVVQDPQIFDRLSSSMRKVIGLEMEAMAIGAVAHAHQDKVRYMIVMKGVMDHADEWKNDAAKTFAARASAECLLAFSRKHLPPTDRFADLLVTGTAQKPEAPAPSALLHAKYRYIQFYQSGRQAMLDRLHAFCDGDARAAVWLIHADGGMGKTRLMIEFCEDLRKRGWLAGFLPKSTKLDRFEALAASELSALVVIDYAESRPELPALLELLTQAKDRGSPLRLVLLARNAGDWWTLLINRNGNLQQMLLEHPPAPLEGLVEQGERVERMKDVAAQFASVLGKPLPSNTPPTLDDSRFERALYLHLAALAWVEQIPFTAESLLDDILLHEERFWVTQANALGDAVGEEIFVEQMREAVAAMTLCGGITSKEAGKDLLRRLNDCVDDRLLAFLRRLYPAIASGYTSPLEPDLLGDGMVWRTMEIRRKQGDKPEPFLERIFRGESDSAITTGFGVLGRLSVDHAGVVRPWIAHLLDADLSKRALLALNAAKTLGTKTAHAWVGYELAAALNRAGTVELAKQIGAAGLPDPTVSLREVHAWVLKSLLTMPSANGESIEARAKRAQLLNNLSDWQTQLGQRDVALVSMQEVVHILRKLVDQGVHEHLPNLANSFVNLGATQSDLGRREEAVASTYEAIKIQRILAQYEPETFLPHLAMSLNNFGVLQSHLGEYEVGLHSIQESIEIYRSLAHQQTDTYLPLLATSLISAGNRQGELGHHETALKSTEEAANIYRTLAQQQPDAYLPKLAMCLTNLTNRQGVTGHHDAAIDSAGEAVEIYGRLAQQRPEQFFPELAASLLNLSSQCFQVKHHADALEIAQAAFNLYWHIYHRYPQKFEAHIRKAVHLVVRIHLDINAPFDETTMARICTLLSRMDMSLE